MRNLSYAALALLAGLAVSGAARADQYTADMNREQYAVSAQGFNAAANEALLPANAGPTAKVLKIQSAASLASGPFADTDAHSGPSHN